MKVLILKGVLVSHTKDEPDSKEFRFYATSEKEVAKGDIFSVWAHSKLAYFKVKEVYAEYEYIKAENGGTQISDIPLTIGKVDIKNYNIFKAVAAKTKRLMSALHERMDEVKGAKDVGEVLKIAKGSQKAGISALVAQIKALEEDPESALED